MRVYNTLKTENFIENLNNLIKKSEEKIEKLIKNTKKPSYEIFVLEYNKIFDELGDLIFPLYHIYSLNSEEVYDLIMEVNPIISNFSTTLSQREDIYNLYVKSLENFEGEENIKRYLKDCIKGFENSGIGKSKEIKDKIRALRKDLSDLTSKYNKNINDDISKFKIIVDDKDDVSEIPENELSKYEKDGKYIFTLHRPSYNTYMKYGTNRNIRKKLYKASISEGSGNEDIVPKIIQLKWELSNILGYNSYSEYSMEGNMEENPTEILNMYDKLISELKPLKDKEDEDFYTYLKKEYNLDKDDVELWDKSYYLTKYKEDKLDYNTEEIKKYFEVNNTLNNLFSFLKDKFKLTFKEVEDDKEKWHESVKTYNVYRNGEYKSRVYFDLFIRDNKSSGAWFNKSDVNESVDGEYKNSVGYVVCNFPIGTNSPSLLDFNDVTTLFHEVGHLIQHICSDVSEKIFSGISDIERDAIEWSSQLLEMFCYTEHLYNFSQHYKTGEKLPKKLYDKIIDNKNYRIANSLAKQVVYGLFDMKIYNEFKYNTSKDIRKLYENLNNKLGFELDKDDEFYKSFQHIFSGGYSSKYYSYIYSLIMSFDSFTELNKRGDYDNYYEKFLSLGSSKKSKEMFIDYVGREPSIENFINYYLN